MIIEQQRESYAARMGALRLRNKYLKMKSVLEREYESIKKTLPTNEAWNKTIEDLTADIETVTKQANDATRKYLTLYEQKQTEDKSSHD